MYGHLLATTVLIFRLKIPNRMPTCNYPTSASNLLDTYFGHLPNKWQVPISCLPNIYPFVGSDRHMDVQCETILPCHYREAGYKNELIH